MINTEEIVFVAWGEEGGIPNPSILRGRLREESFRPTARLKGIPHFVRNDYCFSFLNIPALSADSTLQAP